MAKSWPLFVNISMHLQKDLQIGGKVKEEQIVHVAPPNTPATTPEKVQIDIGKVNNQDPSELKIEEKLEKIVHVAPPNTPATTPEKVQI